jgi:hypothetical protein
LSLPGVLSFSAKYSLNVCDVTHNCRRSED